MIMTRDSRDSFTKRLLMLNYLLVLSSPVFLDLAKCHVETSTSETLVPTTTIATTISSTTTTSDTNLDSNSNAANSTGVLISGDEFVDFTETPLILIDGVANENTTANSTSTLITSEKNESSSQINATITHTTTTAPTTTSTTNETLEVTTAIVPLNIDDEIGNENATSSCEFEGESGETEDQDQDFKAEEVIDEEEFKPPQNVSQYMDYIERLFHDLRHQITDLFEPHIPQLIRTSQMVQLSGSCSHDMLRMALALRQFEPWALRMIDSSGKVPEGIFEGSFTALGSYDECLNTRFGLSHSDQPGPQKTGSQIPPGATDTNADQQVAPQTQGKYCLVNVSPFLPPKPPADRVERLFQEEANRRNYTKVSR